VDCGMGLHTSAAEISWLWKSLPPIGCDNSHIVARQQRDETRGCG
jgi:hypothetical protein